MCFTKLFKANWINKYLSPILLFIGIGFIIWLIFFFTILDSSEKITINWITIFGTYTSIYALFLTLYQIFSLKRSSELTRNALIDNNKLVISFEVSKNIRFLREAKNYVNSVEYKPTILRLGDVKDFLTRLDSVTTCLIQEDNPNFLTTLVIDMGNIEDALYRGKKIDVGVISINIENLITSISKCENNINTLIV